jgi:hypothetical protein
MSVGISEEYIFCIFRAEEAKQESNLKQIDNKKPA